jgi:hypothetical protein
MTSSLQVGGKSADICYESGHFLPPRKSGHIVKAGRLHSLDQGAQEGPPGVRGAAGVMSIRSNLVTKWRFSDSKWDSCV